MDDVRRMEKATKRREEMKRQRRQRLNVPKLNQA